MLLVLKGIPGKGHAKVLTAGIGWAGAEVLLTKFLLLWIGARGAEFDWKYIQKSLESNISLVSKFSRVMEFQTFCTNFLIRFVSILIFVISNILLIPGKFLEMYKVFLSPCETLKFTFQVFQTFFYDSYKKTQSSVK